MLQDNCPWLQAVLLRDEVHQGLASEHRPEVQAAEQRLQLSGQPQRLVPDRSLGRDNSTHPTLKPSLLRRPTKVGAAGHSFTVQFLASSSELSVLGSRVDE